MEENFIWKSGQSSITVIASGLYKIQAGVFKDKHIEEVSCYLLLNGEPIGKLKGKEKNISISNANKARGIVFSESILLPAKSKLALRIEE